MRPCRPSRPAFRVLELPCLMVAAIVWLAAGCGAEDPVKADLELYLREVIRPVSEAEKQVDSVVSQIATTTPPAEELLTLYEKQLLPLYKAILGKAEGYSPRTGPVQNVNRKLVELYRKAVSELDRASRAIRARDQKNADAANKALSAIKFDAVQRELADLATRYNARIPPDDVRK